MSLVGDDDLEISLSSTFDDFSGTPKVKGTRVGQELVYTGLRASVKKPGVLQLGLDVSPPDARLAGKYGDGAKAPGSYYGEEGKSRVASFPDGEYVARTVYDRGIKNVWVSKDEHADHRNHKRRVSGACATTPSRARP